MRAGQHVCPARCRFGALREAYGRTMTPLRCQLGLNGLNFFAGAVQTAFGPFFTVYLTEQGLEPGRYRLRAQRRHRDRR